MRYSIWIVTLLGLLVASNAFAQDPKTKTVVCIYKSLADSDLNKAVAAFIQAWQNKLSSDEIRRFDITQCKVLSLTPTKDAVSLIAQLGYKTEGHGLLNVRWNGRVNVELPFLRQNNTWKPLNQLAKVTAKQKPPIGPWTPDNSDIGPLVQGSITGEQNASETAENDS